MNEYTFNLMSQDVSGRVKAGIVNLEFNSVQTKLQSRELNEIAYKDIRRHGTQLKHIYACIEKKMGPRTEF